MIAVNGSQGSESAAAGAETMGLGSGEIRVASALLAPRGMTPDLLGIVSIGIAGLTMAVGAAGAAIGESRIASAAMDALARQPDESAPITRTLFVSLAMVESTAIFCLVVSLILLFANPFMRAAGG